VSEQGLDVIVTCGTGTAPTELAAFDAALHEAGVAHFNLIRLSSLIPPGSSVSAPRTWPALAGGWGDRLYAVYADHRVSTPGAWACAGLGWIQDEDSGAGMLVEHRGDDEAAVEARLKATLEDLAGRRPGRFGPRSARITSIVCADDPVAAVVVAALRVEPW
jgi:arginine decarboxylase